MIASLHIQISPDRPRMKLSADLILTDEFRAEYDAWLLQRFGTSNLVPDGQVYEATLPDLYGGEQKTLICNPRTYEQLKRKAECVSPKGLWS